MNGSLPQLGRRYEGWVALQLVLLHFDSSFMAHSRSAHPT